MLKTPAEFPHPGATAFVSPHGEEVRIYQRCADGAFLLRRLRHPAMMPSASDVFRAEAGTVHAKVEAAIGVKPAKRRRAA